MKNLMKKIINNFWVQLFLGLIIGILGAGVSAVLAFISSIKYAGFTFFGFVGSSGDESLGTLVISIVFTILIFVFPIFVWRTLNKVGKLKTASKMVKIFTFVIFATVPIWAYFGGLAFIKFQIAYKDYRSVRDLCVIKNGVNRVTIGENIKEFECKNGVFNGIIKIYNVDGISVYEGFYLNGKLDGIVKDYYDSGKIKSEVNYKNGGEEGLAVYYNENGSTSAYIVNEKGETNRIYYQLPETRDLLYNIDLNRQDLLCQNIERNSYYFSYSCSGDVVNGEFTGHSTFGETYLEFNNGKLDGRVYMINLDNKLGYEGQYTDGLQEGIFRRYSFVGHLESEVVFEKGRIVQINTP